MSTTAKDVQALLQHCHKRAFRKLDFYQLEQPKCKCTDMTNIPIGITQHQFHFTVITYGLGGDNGIDSAYKYRAPTTYNTPPYYGYYDYTLGKVPVGGRLISRLKQLPVQLPSF